MTATITGSLPSTTRRWTGRVSARGSTDEMIDSHNAFQNVGWCIAAAAPADASEFAGSDHNSGQYSVAYSASTASRVNQPAQDRAVVTATLGTFPLVDPAWLSGMHFYWCLFGPLAVIQATQEIDP